MMPLRMCVAYEYATYGSGKHNWHINVLHIASER